MKSFTFEKGSARGFAITGILATLLTMITFGIALPWATVMIYKWKAKYTRIEGRRIQFTGTGGELIGKWIVWLLLTIVTVGLFTLIWYPRYQKWLVERTEFVD